jgi:hypothetical protein
LAKLEETTWGENTKTKEKYLAIYSFMQCRVYRSYKIPGPMEQMTILLLGFHVGFTYKLENPPAHGTNKATKNHTSITIKRLSFYGYTV